MIQKTLDIAQVQKRLDQDPVGNIYPRSILQGYPQDDAFYRAYQSEKGILICAHQTAYCYGEFDEEELHPFLQMLGVCERISPQPMSGNEKRILVYQPKTVPDSTARWATQEDMPQIWQLLQNNFDAIPPFDEFMQTKTQQRLYLGGKTAVMTKDGKIVSTACVLMQSHDYALLGAAATNPEYRGQGLASQVLFLLIRWLLDQGKTPMILCDNPVAVRLYQHLGFKEYGKMTVKPYVF